MLKKFFNKITSGEFSKRLLIFLEIFIFFTFVLVCVAVFKGMIDGLVAWITGLFGLATIAFGFYYWKAKNENIRKYARGLTDTELNKILKLYDKVFKGGDYDQG